MNVKSGIHLALFFLLSFCCPALLDAQEPAEITFGGQVRPRLEGRTPVDGSWSGFTSMRVRAALTAHLEGKVRVFLQMQDVRVFGEESNTLSDYQGDHLDLHQGFLELAEVPGIGGALRVGRQEMSLGEQRLVGAVDWAQQGRSFDGLRYTIPSMSGMKVDLFGMKLREEAATAHDWESSFFGAYGNLPTGKAGALDVYGLLTTDSREDHDGELTVGGLWKGKAGSLDLRFEGSLQTGQRNGTDVSAYMFGARAGGKLSEATTATLWYDYLSGDDDPGDDEIRVFNTLFATNHLYYGLADYFIDIPTHTGGLGLQDVALKLDFALDPRTGLKLDLHSFRTAEEGDLSTRSLAQEVDLTLTHRLSAAFSFTGGYSFVQAKDGIKELERLSENAHWVYLMLNTVF